MTKRRDDDIVPDEAEQNARWLTDDLPAKETRGEKKRKATQLERLGEVLVKLPPAKLARVPMPDDLAAAVTEARRITARGGYRRQVQFIGRIMRSLDARPIAAALEAMENEDAPSSAAFRAAEVWRARLIEEGDAALDALVKDLDGKGGPPADRTLLRQLLRQAQKELPTAQHPQGRAKHATKALFRELRALFAPPAPGETPDDEDDDDAPA